jgi:membrane-bound lytic murein transglycosylase F
MNKIYYVAVLLLLLAISSCKNVNYFHHDTDENKVAKLQQIKERGKIVVVTDYNSTNYFIYRGQPMGFQFDLLQELSDYLGVKVEVTVSNDLNKNIAKLNNHEIDLIASNLTVTKSRKEIIDFTEPHSQACQVLVQRKPQGWEKLSKNDIETKVIRNQLDLAGKKVYVKKNTAHADRLKHLAEEIGDSIFIVEVNEDVEKLITRVAAGEIDYVVSDENVAYVNQSYYSNIDIETKLSFPQHYAWAVSKGSDDLREAIDRWLSEFKKTRRFQAIYARYYNQNKSAARVASDYFALSTGKISEYDVAIKTYSDQIGWDWRLIASLIYQESRFQPEAVSWAGAFGLMQLMPMTAQKMGVDEFATPIEQIKAGTEFIKWLDQRFSNIEDPQEKIKFVLASYNVGLGHVIDAQNLAIKDGKDPNVWENSVDEYILKKSTPEYYNDPVVKYGYCRGSETFNYVSQILDRYEHYKNIIRDK